MASHPGQRGRRAPTPAALSSLAPISDGFRILPDPLHGQPLTRVSARPAQLRLLLDRSRESAQAGEPSQDYLAVRCDPSRLSFTVTDGVGSSFLGDIAAQILAAHLSDWLGSTAAAHAGDAFEAALATFLQRLSREVMEQVATWPLPDSVPGFVRAALDQQRGYGSEAMFACGVVDLAGGHHPTVTVAWLGDTHVRVLMRDGRRHYHTGQTTDRWSSRLGPRGAVRSRTWPVAQVARVIVCTDGLLPELDAAVELPDAQLIRRLDALIHRPGNDDMALIDVGLTPQAIPTADASTGSTIWRRLTEEPQGRHARTTSAGSALRRFMRAVGPAATTAPAPARPQEPTTTDRSTVAHPIIADLEAPATLRWRRSERGHEVTWSPVAGADSYAVQVCREPSFGTPLLYAVRGLTFTVPPLPGPVFVRLRCMVGADPGPWGTVHDVTTPDGGDDPPATTAVP